MPMLEIGLGLLVAAAGGGAGWLGRGKWEAKQRADAAFERKARRVAGGQKAASTRRGKAEKKATSIMGAASQNDVGTMQAQHAQMQHPNGLASAVDPQLWGRAGNGALHGGE